MKVRETKTGVEQVCSEEFEERLGGDGPVVDYGDWTLVGPWIDLSVIAAEVDFDVGQGGKEGKLSDYFTFC